MIRPAALCATVATEGGERERARSSLSLKSVAAADFTGCNMAPFVAGPEMKNIKERVDRTVNIGRMKSFLMLCS